MKAQSQRGTPKHQPLLEHVFSNYLAPSLQGEWAFSAFSEGTHLYF